MRPASSRRGDRCGGLNDGEARHRRAKKDDGAALIEFIVIGVCLLLPLVYVVLAVMKVQSAAFGVTEAARQAGRAFVQADTADAMRSARVASGLALADQGVSESLSTLTITCPGACHSPGSTATVHVSARVALPFIPDTFADSSLASIEVSADHDVAVELLRGAP